MRERRMKNIIISTHIFPLADSTDIIHSLGDGSHQFSVSLVEGVKLLASYLSTSMHSGMLGRGRAMKVLHGRPEFFKYCIIGLFNKKDFANNQNHNILYSLFF